MSRKALSFLTAWINADDRKPLVIRGARQVGKTWMVRELARLTGKQLIELNFEKNLRWRDLFSTNNPKEVLLNLESELGISIIPENSLLFLDEIQAAPELLAKLRWFYEDMPEFSVVAAGSLLEFTLANHEFSMPVGRIGYLHVEPLSFEEFLRAQQEEQLYEFILSWQWNKIIPVSIHEKLMRHIKEYILIGGMPEAVFNWQKHRSLEKIEQIHQNLLATYRDDFSKYTKKIPTERLDEILQTIPKSLGEKFVFSRVNKQVPTEILKKALQLLSMARVCHKIFSAQGNGVPLGAEIKEAFFKVVLLDIGLVSSLLDIKLHQLKQLDAVSLVNQGGLSEQLVGQLLRTLEPQYKEPKLYYWLREQKSSNAEVDYLTQHNGHVIPIEVKAGSTGSLKSLHQFMHAKGLPIAVRINADIPSITEINVKTSTSDAVHFQLLSLPFYLTGQLYRLLDSAL